MAFNKDSDQRRFLFAIDLDGTLLADSAEGTIHPKTESAIKRAVAEGHIVSIITGRPWRSTKPIYEKLGLNALVGNYNGAHIHKNKLLIMQSKDPTEFNWHIVMLIWKKSLVLIKQQNLE